MASSKKKNGYWPLLIAGVVVLTLAVAVLGLFWVKSKQASSRAAVTAASQNAQVIVDGSPVGDQQRADRIMLGDSPKPAGETPEAGATGAGEESGKTEKNKKSAVEVTLGDNTTGTNKAVITTEPVSPDENNTGAVEQTQTADKTNPDVLYRLQLGAYATEEQARQVAQEVESTTGLKVSVGPKVVKGNTVYRVQAGAFKDKENANSYKRELELKGLTVFVSEEKK